jgi:ATP-dependent helicase Lhr and Lhr-like helicase
VCEAFGAFGQFTLEMTIPASHPALAPFTPAVRDWFARAFAEPTPAQAQAWPAIATGEHVLIGAPTGSGKTLAAFLWALDRLVAEPSPADPRRRRPGLPSPPGNTC